MTHHIDQLALAFGLILVIVYILSVFAHRYFENEFKYTDVYICKNPIGCFYSILEVGLNFVAILVNKF